MRKFLMVSLISLLLMFQTPWFAFAEVKAAGADIPVVIDGGGIAYLIPEVNSPLPKEISIRVDNGRTGHFYIDFTEAGVYRYTIKAGFTRDGEERPADEVFRLTITVVDQDGNLHTIAVINGDDSSKKTDEVRFKDKQESTTATNESSEPSTGGVGTTTVPVTHPDGTTSTRPYETTTPSSTPPGTTAPTTPPPGTTAPPTTTPPPGTTSFTTRPYETKPPETTVRMPRLFRAPKTGDESHLTRYIEIAIASSAGLFGLAMLYTVNTNKLIKKD